MYKSTHCEPTALYRHYSEKRELLYVGISLRPLLRLSNHRKSKWFNEIRSVVISHYPNRSMALKAESKAIANEYPLYNKLGRSMMSVHHIPIMQMPRIWRLITGLSLAKHAAEMGVSPSSLWKFETNQPLSFSVVAKILLWILTTKTPNNKPQN